MHRPSLNPIGRAVYNRHTLQHHQFFTENEMRFANHRDYRVTFFPTYALATFTLISIPAAIVLGFLFDANVGWLFITTTTSVYLIYEFMHFCCHVEDNAFVRNMPFVNTIRRHHTAHHDQSIMMERNMNLTFPIMDWAFGTSDLNRGSPGYDLQRLQHQICEDHHAENLAHAGTPGGRSDPTRGIGEAPCPFASNSGSRWCLASSPSQAGSSWDISDRSVRNARSPFSVPS